MKTMWGSDEHHPYPLRSFTYPNEQVRANEVQRVIVYSARSSSVGKHEEKRSLGRPKCRWENRVDWKLKLFVIASRFLINQNIINVCFRVQMKEPPPRDPRPWHRPSSDGRWEPDHPERGGDPLRDVQSNLEEDPSHAFVATHRGAR